METDRLNPNAMSVNSDWMQWFQNIYCVLSPHDSDALEMKQSTVSLPGILSYCGTFVAVTSLKWQFSTVFSRNLHSVNRGKTLEFRRPVCYSDLISELRWLHIVCACHGYLQLNGVE